MTKVKRVAASGILTAFAPLMGLLPLSTVELSDEGVEPGLGTTTTGVVAGPELVLKKIIRTRDI